MLPCRPSNNRQHRALEPLDAFMQALLLEYRTTPILMSTALIPEIASSWRSDLDVFKA